MGKHSKYERDIAVTKNGEQYAQERMLSFEYDEETKSWVANYKAGILICKVIGIFSSFKVTKRMRKKSS